MPSSSRDGELAGLLAKKAQSKKVTKELRAHADELEEIDPQGVTLQEHFARAEQNERKAKTVEQRLLDAQIFGRLGECTRREAAHMQTGLKKYDRASFVDKLARLMKQSTAPDDMNGEEDSGAYGAELNLHELGENVHALFKTVPSLQFMRGNEDVQPKEVKPRKPRMVAKKGAVVTKPKALEDEDIPQTETDKQIANMMKELKRRGKLNFWEFVIDPDSYVRSIENVFHSSFLVKDAHARLDLQSEPPTIESCVASGSGGGTDAEGAGESDPNAVNSQYIMRFDHNLWQTVIQKYNIQTCVLPSMIVLQ